MRTAISLAAIAQPSAGGLAPSAALSLAVLSAMLAGCPPEPKAACEAGKGIVAVGELCLRVSRVAALRETGVLEDVDPGSALTVSTSSDGGSAILQVQVPGTARAVAIDVDDIPADVALQNGWQSWSHAGLLPLGSILLTAEDGLPTFAEAVSGDPFHVEYGISYTSVVLGSSTRGGAKVVAGALTSHDAVTGFGAVVSDPERARLTIVYGAGRELLPTENGVTRTEAVRLAAVADVGEGLVALGEAMDAAARAAADPRDRPRPARRPPGGWYSWSEHYDDIDQELIRAHIAAMQTHLAPAGLTLVEIDDGWARAWGDWQANERFPDGMAALASETRAANLVPGVWMAPFLVESGSEAASTLVEEVFVHTATGERLEHQIVGNPRRLFVVDATSEAGRAHVAASLAPLVDAGFGFFKMDFLYAAALPGVRAEPVTGVRALREGLAQVRELIGEDAILNGCGAPVGPVLGLVDSLRVGTDISFVAPTWTFIPFAARDLAARRFVFPLAWPDADQFLLREPRTLDEARVGTALVALAGPAYSFGDDLVLLPAERRAMGLDESFIALSAGSAPAVPVLLEDIEAELGTEVYGNAALEALSTDGGFDGSPPSRWRVLGPSSESKVVFDWAGRTVSVGQN